MVKADLENLTEREIISLRNSLTGLNKGSASSVNNYAVTERKKDQTNKSIFSFMAWNGSKGPITESIQRPMQLIITYNGSSVKVEVHSDNSSLENLCVDFDTNKFPDMRYRRYAAVVEYTPSLSGEKRQIVSIALLPYGLKGVEGIMLKFSYSAEYDSILNHPELVVSNRSRVLNLLRLKNWNNLKKYKRNPEFFNSDGKTTLGKLEKLAHVIAKDSLNGGSAGSYLTNVLERIQKYENDAILGLSYDDEKTSNLISLVPWAEVCRAMSKLKDKPRTELSFYERAYEKKLSGKAPFDKDPELLIYHPVSEDFSGKIRVRSEFYHPTLCGWDENNVVGTVTSINKDNRTNKPTDVYCTFIVNGKIEKMRLIVNYTDSLMGLIWGQELLPQVYAQNQQKK